MTCAGKPHYRLHVAHWNQTFWWVTCGPFLRTNHYRSAAKAIAKAAARDWRVPL